MLIKKQLNKFLYLETGILYVLRKYRQEIIFRDSLTQLDKINLVSYEVPLQIVVMVPFSQNWASNSSFGFSADILSANLHLNYPDFTVSLLRKNWVSGALAVNTGMEYETQKAGVVYLGFSFHQPFKNILVAKIEPVDISKRPALTKGLSGAYFTLDLKYFFKTVKKQQDKDTI